MSGSLGSLADICRQGHTRLLGAINGHSTFTQRTLWGLAFYPRAYARRFAPARRESAVGCFLTSLNAPKHVGGAMGAIGA